ncbi:ABC transporter permease [Methylocystis heyeri]
MTFALAPSPSQAFDSLMELGRSGKLLAHVEASLMRVLAGYAIAVIIGIALGCVIARNRFFEDLLLTPLELLRPIPAVAWIPLAILMFPSSEASMIFITCAGALFPILLNTIQGVRDIDERLIASARTLGASGRVIVIEIIGPGALPSIFTGLSIGMGTSWFCLVTAEMISGQFGIGYFTWESYSLQNYPDIVAGMVIIGSLGFLSSAAIARIGAALTPWRTKKSMLHKSRDPQ